MARCLLHLRSRPSRQRPRLISLPSTDPPTPLHRATSLHEVTPRRRVIFTRKAMYRKAMFHRAMPPRAMSRRLMLPRRAMLPRLATLPSRRATILRRATAPYRRATRPRRTTPDLSSHRLFNTPALPQSTARRQLASFLRTVIRLEQLWWQCPRSLPPEEAHLLHSSRPWCRISRRLNLAREEMASVSPFSTLEPRVWWLLRSQLRLSTRTPWPRLSL